MSGPRDFWIWLVGPRTTELQSRLGAEMCFERLDAAVASRWAFFSNSEVAGWVRQGEAYLLKRIYWRNDFRTAMRVAWEADGLRTRVVCRCGMTAWTVGFMAFWFGAVGLLGVGLVASELSAVGHIDPVLWSIPVMLAFGPALMLAGRVLSLGDDAFLLKWIAGTLEAESTAA
jgi:hypothetical protein